VAELAGIDNDEEVGYGDGLRLGVPRLMLVM
jgi:hypothetical protein